MAVGWRCPKLKTRWKSHLKFHSHRLSINGCKYNYLWLNFLIKLAFIYMLDLGRYLNWNWHSTRGVVITHKDEYTINVTFSNYSDGSSIPSSLVGSVNRFNRRIFFNISAFGFDNMHCKCFFWVIALPWFIISNPYHRQISPTCPLNNPLEGILWMW